MRQVRTAIAAQAPGYLFCMSKIPSPRLLPTPPLQPQYLEVWIWSLTEIVAEASYGHQPHELQAGALGSQVFHQGYHL